MSIVLQHSDENHSVYNLTFHDNSIETLVTDTPYFVDRWISETERIHRRRLHYLIIGLDVEWRPNFQTRNHQNPVATLQLCVGHRCLVFQILQSPEIPQSLANFLGDPDYTFAGVGIGNDADKLMTDYGLEVERMADLRTWAANECGERGLMNAGLKELASRVLGVEMNKPKSVTLSRWDDQCLTPSQVRYASVDAFLSFEIGRVLLSGNRD